MSPDLNQPAHKARYAQTLAEIKISSKNPAG
jgi:hypothetical protein